MSHMCERIFKFELGWAIIDKISFFYEMAQILHTQKKYFKKYYWKEMDQLLLPYIFFFMVGTRIETAFSFLTLVSL